MQRAILDLAVEDSYSLPELVTRVSGLQADTNRGVVRKLVQACVREMFELGLLEVVHQVIPGGSGVALDRAGSVQSLADDLEWVDGPQWRSHARVVATQAGRDAYHETF